MGSEDERIEQMCLLGLGYGGGLCVVLIISSRTVQWRGGLAGIDIENWCRDVKWFRIFCK
jgi:hypothetical protein